MFSSTDSVLVAVSGGKDSLSLVDILHRLGYQPAAVYIDLGIGEYSRQSRLKVQRFMEERGVTLHVHELQEHEGAGIDELSHLVHRPACATCGTIKRYQFNRVALSHAYSVLATGHNLDDEAARLLGNVLHWQLDYLDKQKPALPDSGDGFVKKVKPLYRVAEREMAAYAIVNKIDYVVEECPNAQGAKMLLYKHMLDKLEAESPGTKQMFYWGFLSNEKLKAGRLPSVSDSEAVKLKPCLKCGQPTTADTCGYCRMMAKRQSASSAR